ncbi:hypothetical protein [Mycolicibacterium litorale]|nr:hypothetical protein [Mycolicibacterium litorale]
METTIMTQHPEPALPPNTVCEDGWQDDEGQPYRIFSGRDRRVPGVDGVIGTSAIQYSDGTIETSEDDGPHIWLGIAANEAITATQARQLAAQLIDTADEVDRWVSGEPDSRLNAARGSLWLALEKLSQLERDKARLALNCMACRVEAEDVRCPICRAEPGQPCADTDGEPRIAPHASRASVARGDE